jgi:hypothetical protein
MLTALRKALTLLVATALVVTVPSMAAVAAPGDPDGADLPALRNALTAALTDYNNAKGIVDASIARQAELTNKQKEAEARLVELEVRAGQVAAAAYRGQRMSMLGALLGSGSPEGLLHAATTVQYLVTRDDRDLRDLAATRRLLKEQQDQLAAEIKLQQEQLAVLDAKRKQAEEAVKKAGGGLNVSGPTGGRTGAKAAPRNADGSLPSEGCANKDPTGTGGCVSNRMLNAYNEARRFGYTRYTRCWRSGGSGEHPLGKACDFSAAETTFLDKVATGDDKAYGDSLAAWCIANAKALGVLYVIWYKRIWHPGSGWKSYGGDGSPAGDHYNHVHLSMQ